MKGTFLVMLAITTGLKVDCVVAWVHAFHVKPADFPFSRDPHWTVQKKDNLLEFKIT